MVKPFSFFFFFFTFQVHLKVCKMFKMLKLKHVLDSCNVLWFIMVLLGHSKKFTTIYDKGRMPLILWLLCYPLFLQCSNDSVLGAVFHPMEANLIVTCGKSHINFWTVEGSTLTKRQGLFEVCESYFVFQLEKWKNQHSDSIEFVAYG